MWHDNFFVYNFFNEEKITALNMAPLTNVRKEMLKRNKSKII